VAENLSPGPAYSHIPRGDWTRGDEVAGLAAEANYAPDRDQKVILDGLFAGENRTGKSSASSAALIAPRRNLKTSSIIMAVLGWLFLLHLPEVVWTAHEWAAVDKAFGDIEGLISGSRWLTRRVRNVEKAERSKSISTFRGGCVTFRTRTPGGGRSLDGEKIVIDEAWAVRNAHMGSLLPLMAARSMTGDPQIVYGSSAAKADSEVLHPLITAGRWASTTLAGARRERRFLYCEFCAPPPETACDRGAKCTHELDVPGCGCDKPVMLLAANPALGRRISLEYILDTERQRMPPAEFARERMGWHDEPETEVKVITLARWGELADPGSEPAGAVTLSVVYSRDWDRAIVGLAGMRADGNWHTEIAKVVTPAQVVATVGQVIARASRTDRPVCAVGVDGQGFESECIKGLLDLREVFLPEDGPDAAPVLVKINAAKPDDLEWSWGRPVILVKMTAPQVATAYSGFVTSVTKSGNLRHRGQDEVSAALEGAVPREVGDSGKAWGRRKSGADIAPLVAITQARWLHEEKAPLTVPEPEVYSM
jgi:hypothetical protein